MDFIERIFGFSPDGGSGSFELLLFAIPIAGIAYLLVRRRLRRQRKI
jgi:preprotein translocase subunit YajC